MKYNPHKEKLKYWLKHELANYYLSILEIPIARDQYLLETNERRTDDRCIDIFIYSLNGCKQ